MAQPTSAPLLEEAEAVRQRVAERLAGVGQVVVVMSGKGGVGKSAVSVNLAVALAQAGRRVGVLDADLHGPSVAKMLGLRGAPVSLVPGGRDADYELQPAAGPEGLRVQSMDFFLQGNQPLDWEGESGEGAALRGAMEQAALADLLGQTAWGELDFLVIDLAPGSDRLPALARWLPPGAGALAVTLPSEVALLAVERSLRRAHAARVPVIGLVENLAAARCPRCGTETPLGHTERVQQMARDLAVECVARIPFDAALADAADAGRVFLQGAGRSSEAGRVFAALAARVAAWPGAAALEEAP